MSLVIIVMECEVLIGEITLILREQKCTLTIQFLCHNVVYNICKYRNM